MDKKINQAQGPRTGNAGNKTKRTEFMSAKQGGEKQALANSIITALQGRSPDDYIDPRVEPLKANVGPKVNPTANGSKLPSKYKK